MLRYRAVVHKILEDGTEVEVMRTIDEPWYVGAVMADWAKRFKRMPRETVVIPGQMQIDDAA